jgi:hypothetical protein
MSSKNRAVAREAKKEKPILLSLSSISDLPAQPCKLLLDQIQDDHVRFLAVEERRKAM